VVLVWESSRTWAIEQIANKSLPQSTQRGECRNQKAIQVQEGVEQEHAEIAEDERREKIDIDG